MKSPKWQPIAQAALPQLEASIAQACQDATETLLRQARHGVDPRDRMAGEALKRSHPDMAATACKALREGLRPVLAPVAAQSRATAPSEELSFEILDDDAAHEQVELARLTELLREGTVVAVSALERLERTLAGVAKDPAAPTVATPAAIARALWQGSDVLHLQPVERSRALKAVGDGLAPALERYYGDLVSQITGKGPAPRNTAQAAAATTAVLSLARHTRPAELAPFDLQQPGALRQLLPQAATAMAETQPMPDEGDGARIPQLIRKHRAELSSLHERDSDWALLELISRLFGLVLADPNLPEGVKPLIGNLQALVANLARNDPSLLDSHRHPAWVLTNKIASQAIALAESKSGQLQEFLATLAAIQSALGSQPDAVDFERAVERLQKWRKLLVTRKLTELSPTIEFLRSQAHAQPKALVVREQLQALLDAASAPQAAQAFVLDVWAVVIARAGAGDHGFSGDELSNLTQELLWSVNIARHRADRAALLQRVPRIVAGLRLGMDSIGISPSQQDAWLARLAQVHAKALLRAPPHEQPRPEPVADRVAEQTAEQVLEAIQVGDSIRLQMQGDWVVVQLLWVSANRHFLLFSSPTAGRSHSFTSRALLRMAAEGLLRPLETQSALERATERLSTDFGAFDALSA
jgi:hypothetical protein